MQQKKQTHLRHGFWRLPEFAWWALTDNALPIMPVLPISRTERDANMRPNTTRATLDQLGNQLNYTNIAAAIDSYLNADNRDAWMKLQQSGSSRRYFLIWQGEKLDAKAIAKGALKANGYSYENWHTDPIIDALEDLGFAVWDAQRDGEFDLEAATAYELVKRLARLGQQPFRCEALALWGHRCAVSGVSLNAALDAAHIVPHNESGIMSARNSIILRADLHRLTPTHWQWRSTEEQKLNTPNSRANR
jgi:hypothetical protein